MTILRQAEKAGADKKDDKAAEKAKQYAEFAKKGGAVVDVDYSSVDALAKVLEGSSPLSATLASVLTCELCDCVGVDILVSAVGGAALVQGQLNLLAAAIKVTCFISATSTHTFACSSN